MSIWCYREAVNSVPRNGHIRFAPRVLLFETISAQCWYIHIEGLTGGSVEPCAEIQAHGIPQWLELEPLGCIERIVCSSLLQLPGTQ